MARVDFQVGEGWASQLPAGKLAAYAGLPELRRLVASVARGRGDLPAVREADRKQRAKELKR